MLLIVTALPPQPGALAQVAEAAGLALPDARHRLAGSLPRVLVNDGDAEKLGAIQKALVALGVGAILLDPARVPGDEDRIVVRRLEREGEELLAYSGSPTESRHRVPRAAIALFQRGMRVHESSETTVNKEKKFSATRAVVSGGVLLTKTVKTTSTQVKTRKEAFLVIHRKGGGPDFILYETRLDYRFLQEKIQPSQPSNFRQTAAWLKAFAPEAPWEERLLEPGITQSVPPVPADPVDVLLELFRTIHES